MLGVQREKHSAHDNSRQICKPGTRQRSKLGTHARHVASVSGPNGSVTDLTLCRVSCRSTLGRLVARNISTFWRQFFYSPSIRRHGDTRQRRGNLGRIYEINFFAWTKHVQKNWQHASMLYMQRKKNWKFKFDIQLERQKREISVWIVWNTVYSNLTLFTVWFSIFVSQTLDRILSWFFLKLYKLPIGMLCNFFRFFKNL